MPWSPPDIFSLIAAFCFGVILPWAQRTDGSLPPVTWWLALAGLPFLVLAAGWERGAVAAFLAFPALIYAIWLFAHGGGRFLGSWDERPPIRWLHALSTTGPLIAAIAWMWSRYDGTFAGFPDPLATLTTVHFAITFGALPAALVAGTKKEATPRPWNDLALWIYVISAPATALCFALRAQVMIPSLAEVFCAVLFALSFFVWWVTIPSRRSRGFALPLLLGFALGAGYTLTQYLAWPYFSLPEMLMGHGMLNLAGTSLLIAFAPVTRYLPCAPDPDPEIPLHPGSEETAHFVDDHRRELGIWTPERFGRVRNALLGYRFYPPSTMIRRAQFEEEGRSSRVGDRLGLGLFLPNLPGLHPLCLAAVVEISQLTDESERVKLGYVTTRKHYGSGEWIAEVGREGDQMILSVRCHIRPTRWFVWLGLPFYRYFQLRAFHAGFTNLLCVAKDESATLPDRRQSDS